MKDIWNAKEYDWEDFPSLSLSHLKVKERKRIRKGLKEAFEQMSELKPLPDINDGFIYRPQLPHFPRPLDCKVYDSV